MAKILVIDDEKILRKRMKSLLELDGYETFTAGNGEESLEIFRKENPEIVLVDIKLPGIAGIEVLRQIKEEEKDTEVIMITGHAGIDSTIEALKIGAFGYLQKPLDYDELEIEIKKALKKQEIQKKLAEHVHNLEEAVEEKKRELNRRMQAEEDLKQSDEKHQNLVKFANVGIIAAEEGKIVQVNKRAEEIYGYSKGELVDRTATVLVPEEYRKLHKKILQEIIETEKFKMLSFEEEGLRKDGTRFPLEIAFSLSRGKDNYSVIAVIRDITERQKMAMQLKEATAQLVQSEKLSALGELTAGVAHELKQPLNGIKIISQSLLKDIEKGQLEKEELGKDLEDVVNQITKMADIIDHMRIFTRTSEGTITEPIDINSLVEGAFTFLGQQLQDHNIEVGKDLSSDLPKVVGDPNRLEQVLLNLISNARNAVESNGKEKKRIDIRTYAANTNGDSIVVMEVRDNGGGVPEYARKKIFQPFFTTNAPGKGTGLGLSVSNKIIEEHRGRIELDSTVGEGTTFRVILPTLQ